VKRSALFVGVLLADNEVGRPPLNLTVVGPKDDPAARALFEAALQYPSFYKRYKRLEWWDTREGKLPNPDAQYPSVPRAAAYVCTERTCSAPIFTEDVCARGNRVLGLQEQGCVVVSAGDSGEVRPVKHSQEWLCHTGLGEFAELSTRSVLDPGYKVFASGDDIFASRRTLIGRKVRPAVETPTGARVLAQTKRSQLPCGQDALRKSHGLLAELLPEVGEVKFIQEDVGENDKVK
jgi:hypothetical protein